jgi:hypothetical protein
MIMGMSKVSLIFILLFLLCPIHSPAGEDPKVWSLRGISAFQLIVEKPTPDAREAGITEEAIRNQVGAFFTAFLPHVPLDGKEGPSLYVRIILYKRQKEDLYYGTIGVHIDRAVTVLSPQGDFPAFSQVWENTAVFSGRDPLLATYEILAKLLNLLVEDFKEANPSK